MKRIQFRNLAVLLVGFTSACQVDDNEPNNPGNGAQCTADSQCSATTTWTKGFCNYGTCDEFVSNCGGIKTRRTSGQTAVIEAWDGFEKQPNEAIKLGNVPITTNYTEVPFIGACAVVSTAPFDCTIEFDGVTGELVVKTFSAVRKCTWDGLNMGN